jgi:hypothetical protein
LPGNHWTLALANVPKLRKRRRPDVPEPVPTLTDRDLEAFDAQRRAELEEKLRAENDTAGIRIGDVPAGGPKREDTES